MNGYDLLAGITWIIALVVFAFLAVGFLLHLKSQQAARVKQSAEYMPEYPHIPEKRTDFDIQQEAKRLAADAVRKVRNDKILAEAKSAISRARNAKWN